MTIRETTTGNELRGTRCLGNNYKSLHFTEDKNLFFSGFRCVDLVNKPLLFHFFLIHVIVYFEPDADFYFFLFLLISVADLLQIV